MPKRNDIHKVLIIGSGPVVIGQACEFDYSGTQACKALRKLGYEIVLVNSNPTTITTDPGMADATYIEPLNIDAIEKIAAKERPDALLPNVGGQTALNLTAQLSRNGILDSYGIQVIGVTPDAIEHGENRQLFKQILERQGLAFPKSEIAQGLEQAEEVLKQIDLPCMIRPSYTLGGIGGGLVYNLEEFRTVVRRSLSASLVDQILIEESVEGWEELELVILRDNKGQKITVCLIENIDCMGVHSGDSFCTAPMCTASPELQAKLQEHAYSIMDAIDIVGCSDVKFAHDSRTGQVFVVEINPRASRSSSFASKATGVPVAFASTLLACGLTLDEIPHRSEKTLAAYVPQNDIISVKSPRWAFEKFKGDEDRLGAQMHAVGEVMGTGNSYKEALQKSVRALEIGRLGLGFARDFNRKSLKELMGMLWRPTSERLFIMYEALRKGADIDELYEKTKIKPWFIQQLKELVELEQILISHKGSTLPKDLMIRAKQYGFADGYLSKILGISEEQIRTHRTKAEIKEAWRSVPVSGEKHAVHCYSTYIASDQSEIRTGKKIMILGYGPNRIGQGSELDYCGTHASFALRDLGCQTIVVQCNPGNVCTDYTVSDKLYFEPLTTENILGIYEKENPEGVIIQFGGQTPLKIRHDLQRAGIRILGTPTDSIDHMEDRVRFRNTLEKLGIPQPASGAAHNLDEAIVLSEKIGYPLMVRPAHSPAGGGMEIAHDQEDLTTCLKRIVDNWPDRPILVDRFLENALEAEADVLSDGTDAFIPAVMEHIELAGIHSGDSACVLPPVSIADKHRKSIEEYTKKIAAEFHMVGLWNIQYAITNDTVYFLGIKPYASRTVPLVSKVCNIPLVRMATQVILGTSLGDLNLAPKTTSHFGVKEAVFPFDMFHNVDPILGPEMHSTGEVLGIADSFELAFYKSQEAAHQQLPGKGTVLISVTDQDKKDVLDIAREFARMQFKILATEGTHSFLSQNGIDCNAIPKINAGRPNIVDAIKNGDINLLVNTPLGKKGSSDDSNIRKTAIDYKVAYITTLAAAKAAAKGIAAFRSRDPQVMPLQQYHSEK